MSLTLTSTDPGVSYYLQQIDADKTVTQDEFEKLSKNADRWADSMDYKELGGTMKAVQDAADVLAAAIQALARTARTGGLEKDALDAVTGATEFQLAYVIGAYKTSFEGVQKTS
ncbi:hypothetical protein FHW69_003635 [Luteibacter sp. Sphag1AF]|uniref:hypothetical protein n=1 Tax=Luteibacter sp. Sphag1AF TaxID=2587031 RepID=UPI00160EC039|nr:hypothetical protein [Luteibacter sp. Sphag1AF]MBB3228987.1 hypothetical protein [Luteibacter sp. Sphag1AF]